MQFEWDDDKREANLAKHGVDFALALQMEWDTAMVWHDKRHDYGERRLVALGLVGGRIYSCAYTLRGHVRRIISLRKANLRERRSYEEDRKTKTH